MGDIYDFTGRSTSNRHGHHHMFSFNYPIFLANGRPGGRPKHDFKCSQNNNNLGNTIA